MTPKQLKKRQVFVKATERKSRLAIKKFSRRDVNKIEDDREEHPNDVFDSFFDFEEDLSSLKPASEQIQNIPQKTVMNKNDSYTKKNYTILKKDLVDINKKIPTKKLHLL